MALSFTEKKLVVKEVAQVAQDAISLVAAEYNGLSALQMTKLRQQARDVNVHIRVVKNNLANLALQDTDFDCITQSLSGPLFLAFSMDAPGAAARLLRDFAKDNDKLAVKAIALNGDLIDASNIDAVANLPTYEEAIVKLLLTFKAPITKFVRTTVAPQVKLVRTLTAVKNKLENN